MMSEVFRNGLVGLFSLVLLISEAGPTIGDIELSANSYDFGSVVVGDSLDWVLAARNVGADTLTVYSINWDEAAFSLSDTIDQSKIEAEYKNGVLLLRLPKAEKAKSRQISVNAGKWKIKLGLLW